MELWLGPTGGVQPGRCTEVVAGTVGAGLQRPELQMELPLEQWILMLRQCSQKQQLLFLMSRAYPCPNRWIQSPGWQ